jgi:hypothetical protein
MSVLPNALFYPKWNCAVICRLHIRGFHLLDGRILATSLGLLATSLDLYATYPNPFTTFPGLVYDPAH